MPRDGGSCSIPMLVLAGVLLAGTATRAQSRAAQPDTRLKEAERALASGNTARAFDLGSAYVKAHPREPSGRLLLARVHVERGALDAAYEELDRALRADPRNVDVLAHMGLVSGQLAAAAFERLAAEAPGSARVQQLMGETLEAQDRRADAEAAYEAALTADPGLLEALLALGKLKRIRLACEEAIGLYKRAEAIRSTFDGAFGLGTCFAVEQEDAQAILHFRQALAHDERAAVAWEGLGAALARDGRPTEGIAALQRAIALEPRMNSAYYALGQAYRRIGDEQRAQAAFDKARQLQTAERP